MGSGSCSGTAPGLAGDQGTRWGHPQPSAQRLSCQGDNSTWDEPSTEPGRIGPPPAPPHLLPSPGEPPCPSTPSSTQRPRPGSVTAAPMWHRWHRGLREAQTCTVLLGRGDPGVQGWLGVLPAGPCPPRGVPVTVTVRVLAASRQPRGAAAPRCLLPWPCPRSLPRPRLFLLSPLLFFSLFFPPKTPPRGTHGEEEAQFPIVSIFLFIVLLGKNTALPANKRAFIRRPQSRGIQGKMSAPRRAPQPLLWAETPPGHQSPLGTLLPASRIKLLPPHSEFPALRCHPAGLPQWGPPCHPKSHPRGSPAVTLGLGTKQGGTMGLCAGPPLYQHPQPWVQLQGGTKLVANEGRDKWPSVPGGHSAPGLIWHRKQPSWGGSAPCAPSLGRCNPLGAACMSSPPRSPPAAQTIR